MVTQNTKRDLEGKVAIVTGATSGIGLAVAKELIARGANVTLNGIFFDIKEKDPKTGEVKIVKSAGVQLAEFRRDVFDPLRYQTHQNNPLQEVKLCIANVADEKEAEKIVKTAAENGPIDILVNSAGIHPPEVQRPLEEVDTATARRLMDVNYWGVFNMQKAAVPHLRQSEKGATVLNISSVHGVVGSLNRCAYVGAKFGLEGLTTTFNGELRDGAKLGQNPQVLTICPAFVKTELALKPVEILARGFAEKNNVPYEDAYKLAEGWRLQHQGGKWIELEDIANACADIAMGKKQVTYQSHDGVKTVDVQSGEPVIFDNGYTKPPHAKERVVKFVPFEEFVRQEAGKVQPGMCDEGHGMARDSGQQPPAGEPELEIDPNDAELQFMMDQWHRKAGSIA